MEDGEIDDSEINPVGETLIMEMAKRIEDHNSEINMDNIDRMIVDKTLCVIGCNELHTKDILAFFKIRDSRLFCLVNSLLTNNNYI